MNETKLRELGIAGIANGFVETEEESVARFEAVIGKALPPAYRYFLKHFGSSLFEQNVRFPYIEACPWAVNGYGAMDLFYGLGGDPAYDISKKFERFRNEESPTRLLPIGHDAGSNQICLDIDAGNIHFRDKDTAKTYVIANSFEEFIDSFEIEADTL